MSVGRRPEGMNLNIIVRLRCINISIVEPSISQQSSFTISDGEQPYTDSISSSHAKEMGDCMFASIAAYMSLDLKSGKVQLWCKMPCCNVLQPVKCCCGLLCGSMALKLCKFSTAAAHVRWGCALQCGRGAMQSCRQPWRMS